MKISMRGVKSAHFLLILTCFACHFAPRACAADEISVASLLREMADRDALARWPSPEYTSHQASSYDRASKTPGNEAWFANHDYEQYIREENNAGRAEWVLMDADGPGCMTRFWIGGQMPKGHLRFYLDGATEPAIDAPAYKLLSGKAFVKGPLSIENSPVNKDTPGGLNLFLPIPYAKHCKITYGVDGGAPDKPPLLFWYNIEHRTYAAGTAVQTFTMNALNAAQKQAENSAKDLQAEPSFLLSSRQLPILQPGAQFSTNLPRGSMAVRELTVKISTERPEELEQALRSTVLIGTFDDEQTIWCPLGDFFGSGVGLNELKSWQRCVKTDGTLVCNWTMPYQKSVKFTLLNLGKTAITTHLLALVTPWKWDARSMHFYATWRQQTGIPTRPFSDWNYLTANGQGVYVGDTLCVFNTSNWWGEGDEKVFVDGEAFPSHFGTGSEDHYGYAWGNVALFQGPFSNEVRADGPNGGHQGHTVVTRTRSLDAIPFTKNLQYDMEIWHWKDTQVNYAATCYWYARPGATSNRAPQPDEAAKAIPQRPGVRKIAGAIELETVVPTSTAPGVGVETQRGDMLSEGKWSGEAQMFVRANKVGDFVEITLPAPDDKPRKITIFPTKSYDYGVWKFFVNGEAAKQYDAYSDKAILGEPLEIGTFTPHDGKFNLRLEVAGTNPESRGPRYYFGLDAVTISAP